MELVFPSIRDIDIIKNLYLECYGMRFPLLKYKVLLAAESLDNEYADFYHQQPVNKRTYLDGIELNFSFEKTPYVTGQTVYGTEKTHTLRFRTCTPLLEELGLEPEQGDLIMLPDVNQTEDIMFEVMFLERVPESYYAEWNWWGEVDFVCEVPNIKKV